MITFVSLILNNFVTHKKSTIALNTGCITSIQGVNKDFTYKKANGVGKSLIGDGLTWVLYGKTIRGFTANNVIGKFSKGTAVTLVLTEDKTLYEITRSRKNSRTVLDIVRNSKNISKHNLKDNEELIEHLIGCDFDIFRNSCLIGQNDTRKFIDSKPFEQENILNKLLKTDEVERYGDKAKKLKAGLHSSIIVLKEEQKEIINQILIFGKEKIRILKSSEDDVKELEKERREMFLRYRKLFVKIQNFILTASESEIKLDMCFERLKSAQKNSRNLVKVLEKESTDSVEKVTNIKYKLKSFGKDVDVLVEKINASAKRIRGLDKLKGNCDKCGSLVTIKSKNRIVKSINKETLKFNEQIKTSEKTADLLDKKWRKVDKEVAKNYKKLTKHQRLLQKIEDYLLRADRCKLWGKLISKLDKKIKKKKDKPKTDTKFIDKNIGKLSNKLTRMNIRIDNGEQKIAKYHYWEDGFKEIARTILGNAMIILSEKSQEYLNVMMNSEMQVDFNYDIDSKRTKLKIDIEDLNGKRSIQYISGGERGRISIAIDFAFAYLASIRMQKPISFIFIDEMFDALDDIGKEMAVKLVEKLHEDIKSIFLISHDKNIENYFYREVNKLSVVLKGGKSRVYAK